jgi:hypothetical protein
MNPRVILLGVAVVVSGLTALAFGYAAHRQDMELRKWPSAAGRIMSSKIMRTTNARLKSSLHESNKQAKREYDLVDVWVFDVEYHYTFDGVDYIGSRATSCHFMEDIKKDDTGPGETLRTLETRYPANTAAAVRYNPADPSESYLSYLESPRKYSLFKAGGALLILGMVIALVGKQFPS